MINYLGNATPKTEPDGKLSYKLDSSFHPIHGGVARYPINGADVVAVFAKITTELVLDNPKGVDDRAAAQILVSIGADYYPTMATTIADFAPTGYNPGVGGSRFGLVKIVPANHYFATINPPGNKDNPQSPFAQGGGLIAIPVTQFAANPPPLP